jgi:uncharacterized protein YigE (DUF2233 family)
VVSASASALECSQVVFRDIRSTVCKVDIRTDRLQLFLADAAGKPFKFFQPLAQSLSQQGEQLVFAMNAGMYREDYSPLGLFVANGRQVHRINLASGYGSFYLKPNGVLVLSPDGARLVESSEYGSMQQPITLATQSGPLLVHAGAINPILDPRGTSRFVRNGVGVVNANEVVFAITSEPVNFYEFALLFRDQLKCTDALYLDGSISSLYSRSLGRDDEQAAIGPMIGVTVPAPVPAPAPAPPEPAAR